MREFVLKKWALAASLAGIFALYFILSSYNYDRVYAVKLPDDAVELYGRVININANKGVVSAVVEVSENVSAVFFSPENFSLKRGDFIRIKGKVGSYNGHKQVVVSYAEHG